MKNKLFKLLLTLVFIISISGCTFNKRSTTTTLGKQELKEEYVHINGEYIYYKGGEAVTLSDSELIIIYNDRNLDNDLFDLSYSNNIEVGTASLTITCKEENEYLYGSVTVEFTIQYGGSIEVKTFSELKNALNSSYANIEVVSDILTIPVGEIIEIPLNRSFSVGKGSIIYNYGTINFKDNNYIGVLGFGIKLYNYGTISSDKIFSLSGTTIYNMGTINAKETILSYDAIYTNSAVNADKSKGRYVLREEITNENISLDINGDSIKYSSDNKALALYNGGSYSFNYVYENIDSVGTAKVTISLKDEDPLLYGSVEKTYSITLGDYSFESLEDLFSVIDNPNYSTYTYAGDSVSETLNKELIIPENKTVDFGLMALTLNQNLTNYGDLTIVKELKTGADNITFNNQNISSVKTFYGNIKIVNGTNGTLNIENFSNNHSYNIENNGLMNISFIYYQSTISITNNSNLYIHILQTTNNLSIINNKTLTIGKDVYKCYFDANT
ncbi:MAG: hypothetical protein K6G38_05830, partial [Gammaproteobacteria bacterium]|nr:hypothetical protein [Gammaproteobacteria bacterium]